MNDDKDDLLKYYKTVITCKLCKRLYGCDYLEHENMVCPVCSLKLTNKKSIFSTTDNETLYHVGRKKPKDLNTTTTTK